MSDFSRLLEIAMEANQPAAQEAVGVPAPSMAEQEAEAAKAHPGATQQQAAPARQEPPRQEDRNKK